MDAGRIVVTGNLKQDLKCDQEQVAASEVIRKRIGNRMVIVAASTHEGEEELLIKAWIRMNKLENNWLLILAPRHPQRFQEVARLIRSHQITCIRRSQGDFPEIDQSVWLADTMGEMQTWFAIADLAFVGGSLIPHGGHNPIEALMHRCPVISGRHIDNFFAIYRELERRSALVWIEKDTSEMIQEKFDLLMRHPKLREQLAELGYKYYLDGAGATGKTLEMLNHLIGEKDGHLRRHG
jgi:3-deoxy-D-manno-octulosonic-acid transferase